MSEVHTYNITGRWVANRSGVVRADGVAEALPFSAPPEFHGEAGRWSPETLLLAAASSCFLTTLVAIAEFSKVEFSALEISSEALLERVPGQGYRFTEIVLRPLVTLVNEADREKALRLLEKTEKSCIVARSLQTPLRVEPTVRVGAAAA